MLIAVVYIHIFRGLYYGSYKAPRELLWLLGVIILVLMMATAFFRSIGLTRNARSVQSIARSASPA
jgi:quinol-cytochrome oxidoreductase complex cytochrome b subunit